MWILSMCINSSRIGIARRASLGRHNQGAKRSQSYAQRRSEKRTETVDRQSSNSYGRNQNQGLRAYTWSGAWVI